MFIYDFVQIPQPYAVVRDRMLATGSSRVDAAAAAAYGEGAEAGARLGPRDSDTLDSEAVRIHVGTAYDRGDGVVLPMSWVAIGASGVFPSMEADLGVAPLGASVTQITLSGMYQPQLGKVGQVVGALVLHRLGEATVRSFLTRLADAVQLPAVPAG